MEVCVFSERWLKSIGTEGGAVSTPGKAEGALYRYVTFPTRREFLFLVFTQVNEVFFSYDLGVEKGHLNHRIIKVGKDL